LAKLLEYWNQNKQKLASQKLTVALLLLLALFTVFGTIYQVEYGLYAAQKKFFNSPIVLLWFIPLPSVQLVLWALFINLVAGLQTRIRWKKVSLGIFLAHWGLLLLLISGFYSLYFSHESFIELRENETTNKSLDYYNWQLVVVNENSGDKQNWSFKSLHPGKQLKTREGLKFSIQDVFENSRIFDTPFAGRILKKLDKSKEAEQNIPSLIVTTSTQQLQLHGDGLRSGNISHKGQDYVFSLMRKKYTLPFSLELEDINRKLYPGTEIAKSYKSEVIVHEANGLRRNVKISMNKPLRYWQYTVYQASYGIDDDGGEFSIFAVVENHGRALPYIASLIMALGIFLHFTNAFLAFLRARTLIALIIALTLTSSAVQAEEIVSAPSTEATAELKAPEEPAVAPSNSSPDATVNPEASNSEAIADTAASEQANNSTPEAPAEIKQQANTTTAQTTTPITEPVSTEVNNKTSESKTDNKETSVTEPVIETKPKAAAKIKSGFSGFISKLSAAFKKTSPHKLESESLEMQGELSLSTNKTELGVSKSKTPSTAKPIIKPSSSTTGKLIAKPNSNKTTSKTLPSPKTNLSTIPEQPTAENGKEAKVEEETKAPLLAPIQLQERSSGLLDLSNLGKIKSAQFARMSVADGGRIKPIDTFARSVLIRFSGKSNVRFDEHKLGASEWLTRLIFWPESVDHSNVFLINHPEVLEAFGLEPSNSRRYSFAELRTVADKINELGVLSMQVEEKQRSIVEQEIVRVFDNFHTYLQLRESLKPLMPNADFHISAEEQNLSLYEVLQRTDEIQDSLLSAPLEASSLSSLSEEQKEKITLGISLYAWLEGHKAYMSLFGREQQFRPLWLCDSGSSQCEWYTVWEVISDHELLSNSRLRSQLSTLAKIQEAYEGAKQQNFDTNIIDYTLRQQNSLKRNHQQCARTNLEIFYNNLNPLLLAKLLYGLALLLVIAASFIYTHKLSGLALNLASSAFALHSFAIVARILILARPPVSNLYETFVFVSWVSVLLGLFLNKLRKNKEEFPLGTLLGSFTGFVLLMIASKFSTDGDTMQVVIAVLNSNFWLSTHVICVTIGYAGVASAGLLAHIHLIKECFCAITKRERNYEVSDDIRLILGVLAFGLCFSFVGTILGGIWADQSWGRFWGWDPKENGALLIVLWSAAVFHARLAGLIGARGTAIASAIGTAVVMISWFGINLLGVGLHSYGFTSGLATGFFIYILVEAIFLAVAAYLTSQRFAMISSHGTQN